MELNRPIEQIDLVKSVVEDYTVECGSVHALQTLISKGYKAYLRFPITDWESFTNLMRTGVSDIYIDGPLCFDFQSLQSINHDITKLRLSPTVSSSVTANRDMESFFVRPEDLYLLDGIVDIIEFHQLDQDKEDALYTIYKRGTFNYSIKDLIPGLPDVNNLMFKDEFAKMRLACKQKCKVPGHSCRYCHNYFSIIQKSLELAKQNN